MIDLTRGPLYSGCESQASQVTVRGNSKKFPAHNHMWVNKSNRLIRTDQVQFVVQDRVLNEATKVLSLQLGLTIDTLIRDMMVSTASTIVATHGTNGTVPTEINDTDIQIAIIALRQGNARLMTNPLPGENKFGTAPVRSSYWGFMSVDMQAQLENVSSFISVANYPNPMNALEAELSNSHALPKFSLIDLDILNEDNKAQAEALLLAA